ncbi:MAG TPA: hypothetical protein VGA16_01660 [Candidatus Limnocylindria bacterium]
MPEYVGQSASEIVVGKGEVATLSGIWRYAGGDRTVTKKVIGKTVGSYFYEIRPPVDPDADPTELVDAQSAKFIVAVRP